MSSNEEDGQFLCARKTEEQRGQDVFVSYMANTADNDSDGDVGHIEETRARMW